MPRIMKNKQRKAMLDALQPRYYVFEWDGGYNLYDTTKPAKYTQCGDFVAQIYLNNDCTKYVFNGRRYDSVDDLSKAIDKHIVTLPFYWGNYDPSYRESHFMEICIREYMESLGYELRLWDYNTPYKNGHYVIKGVWGEVISDWCIEVDFDKSTGVIYKFIDRYTWTENRFDGLDDAIGAINAMLIPECLTKGGAMTTVLERMMPNRARTASLGSVDGLNVHIKDQKQVLIEKLEEELKRLKGE